MFLLNSHFYIVSTHNSTVSDLLDAYNKSNMCCIYYHIFPITYFDHEWKFIMTTHLYLIAARYDQKV